MNSRRREVLTHHQKDASILNCTSYHLAIIENYWAEKKFKDFIEWIENYKRFIENGQILLLSSRLAQLKQYILAKLNENNLDDEMKKKLGAVLSKLK